MHNREGSLTPISPPPKLWKRGEGRTCQAEQARHHEKREMLMPSQRTTVTTVGS
ncbi:hypothetical protein LEMLEM_LOCUS25092 [Lemmus lemmus]